ncbi:hypothetical protein EBZ80_21705 [bacterium]|nr:hypothetical protein [bacterium]
MGKKNSRYDRQPSPSKKNGSSSRYSEKSDSNEREPFVFRDRSGKVHTPGGGGRSGHTESHRGAPLRERRETEPSYLPRPMPRPQSELNEFAKSYIDKTTPSAKGPLKLKATVDRNRKGFAFLSFENREYEDAFLPPRETQGLFHGDRVEVTLNSRSEIQSIEVLSHRFREMTGKFSPEYRGKGGKVVYERKKSREEVYLPTLGNFHPEPGDWVRTRLIFPENGEETGVTGEIIEVYGPELPARADVMMIANEYDLEEEHSEEAELEAREQKLEVPGRDLEGREDLREVPFITIDGETARDFAHVPIPDEHFFASVLAREQRAFLRRLPTFVRWRPYQMHPDSFDVVDRALVQEARRTACLFLRKVRADTHIDTDAIFAPPEHDD